MVDEFFSTSCEFVSEFKALSNWSTLRSAQREWCAALAGHCSAQGYYIEFVEINKFYSEIIIFFEFTFIYDWMDGWMDQIWSGFFTTLKIYVYTSNLHRTHILYNNLFF